MSLTVEDLNTQFKSQGVERPSYPSLKIDQDEDSENFGKIYIETRILDEDGKWEKLRKNLGVDKLTVSVLRRRYQFVYFDTTSNTMLLTTNEFDTWQDTVHVLDGGQILISGHYTSEVKPWLIQNYPKGNGGHMMKLLNILYVEYKGDIYRMNLSNTSVQGVKKEITDRPIQNSFEWYMGELWKTGKHPISFKTEITAVFKEKKIGGKKNTFHCFEFAVGENKPGSIEKYNELDTALKAYETMKFKTPEEPSTPSVPTVPTVPTPSFEPPSNTIDDWNDDLSDL